MRGFLVALALVAAANLTPDAASAKGGTLHLFVSHSAASSLAQPPALSSLAQAQVSARPAVVAKKSAMSRIAGRQPSNSVRGCDLPKHLP
jgi:hypothetical protein